jgi:hypothetical protein
MQKASLAVGVGQGFALGIFAHLPAGGEAEG